MPISFPTTLDICKNVGVYKRDICFKKKAELISALWQFLENVCISYLNLKYLGVIPYLKKNPGESFFFFFEISYSQVLNFTNMGHVQSLT